MWSLLMFANKILGYMFRHLAWIDRWLTGRVHCKSVLLLMAFQPQKLLLHPEEMSLTASSFQHHAAIVHYQGPFIWRFVS